MPRRVLAWFGDRAVRKVVRFGIPAAVGKLMGSLAGLITMAILARRLGPGPFGVVAIIRTVVGIVDQYANFNTWLAIIKYGTEAIAQGRTSDVERVVKLGVVVDVVTGILAAFVLAGLAFVIPSTFGWSAHEGFLCAVYGLTLVTRVSGTSDGIFRIADAYRTQAIASGVAAFSVTGAVAIAVGLDSGLDGCIYALVIGEVIGNVVITLSAFRVAGKAGYGGWLRAPVRGARQALPGIVRFLLTTNAQLTVKKTNAELDMIISGAVLGKVSSGLFRVVKQLGTIPGRVFMPFEQVVFTELSRSAASHDYQAFLRLLRRFTAAVALGSLVMWVVAVIAAEPLIRAVAGSEFVGAAPAFRIYLFGMVLVIATAPNLRALIALGRPGTLFLVEMVLLCVLLVTLVTGAIVWGLPGIAAAVVAHRSLQFFSSTWLVRAIVRERRRHQVVAG